MKLNTTTKVIAGEIFDASGHTDFMGSLDEAMKIIMENVKNAGKWAYINGNPFIFQNFDTAEEDQVRDLLDNADAPHFLLTGKLQGGGLIAGSRKAAAAARKAVATRRANQAKAAAPKMSAASAAAHKAVATRRANQAKTEAILRATQTRDALIARRPIVQKAVEAVREVTTPKQGKTLYRGRISKKPISQLVSGKVRAQLAVCIHNNRGVEIVDIFVSDFNGSRGKLQKHSSQIVAGVYNALRPDSELIKDAATNRI